MAEAYITSMYGSLGLTANYVGKFITYIRHYLSKVPDTKYPIYIRLAEDNSTLNNIIENDGFTHEGQFDRSTLGSYLHRDGVHFVYIRMTGNMNTDVFTFCHELAHVLQFEEGKLIQNGKNYLTSDPFFDMDDLEREAMSFARDMIFGDSGEFNAL